MGADEEPNRLRALLALMREFGATKVVTADGIVLERPPLSPLEAAAAASSRQESRAPAAASKDDDEDEDLDGEEEQENAIKAQWTEHWQRLTLSSGSGVPPFPGVERALRFMRAS